MKGTRKYDYLIFDADHTVIDFDEDERRAFRAAFRAAGKGEDEAAVQACWEHSARNWHDLGLNDVHRSDVQSAYHDMYYRHVRTLFDWADTMYGFGSFRAQAQQAFEETLACPAHFIQNADMVLADLAQEYRICIATNGLSQMQRGRLQALMPVLYRLYISEEMRCIKPNAAFFRAILQDLGVAAERCLMVGDSLSSDIAGASAVGMPCVWFCRSAADAPASVPKIADLRELERFL